MLSTLSILILALFPVFVEGNVGIPVLYFEDKLSLNKDSISKPRAGHTIPTKEFTNLVTGVTKTDISIVFLQDELSNKDFLRLGNDMKRGGLFKNLQRYSARETSVLFPSVKTPLHALTAQHHRYNEQIELKDVTEVMPILTKTPLQKDTSLIVHLKPTADEATSSQAIKQNDELIGKVMELVEKSGLSYAAFFTGKSHRRAHEAVVVQGTGRHLLQTEEESASASNSTIFYNSTSCIIYMESAKVNDKPLPSDTPITCKGNATIEMEIDSKLQLTFSKDVFSMWNLVDAKLSGDNITTSSDISAPITFSYHCNDMIIFYANSTTPVVQIARLQIQVFDIEKEGEFGSAYDCTGFFTIPLWTGLFTALFLIGATIYGMNMLNNIQTFDLYDDPKGKPLTINVSE